MTTKITALNRAFDIADAPEKFTIKDRLLSGAIIAQAIEEKTLGSVWDTYLKYKFDAIQATLA